ncbi:synaptotagmin-like protein 2 isoform X2 [Myxocyprinus asiaticus]|uniref:synaptotagmin-like protein 2 isoform X2 n=1 Tax=Myxocyprinus asiaticus TaxID=70543 RepID=UPI002223D839|nr:synaptotagmin-like protein 2 isoform X2 [Myxocyprinus asiaticus]
MKQSKSASELIDLSFLSAEEEAAIRQVLLRDEDLKRLESGRVRKLRQSVPDLKQLKTLTGEWFEELRVKRYGQQTDVTAVVRSSMRWKKTAAHKPNPFLKDILEENKDGEKKERSTTPNPSANPRLIHPVLSKETYHQYTDEDFMDDETLSALSLAGKGSSEKQRAANNGKLALNGTDPRNNSTETQHKEVSGDKTVSPSTVQVQLETKTESGAAKQATNSERRRKVSLPPALWKDQSFEENWVNLSLEPNTIKPAPVESSVGPKLREGKDDSNDFKDDHPFEMGKKKTSKTQDDLFLQNERTADASRVEDFEMSPPHRTPEPRVSGKAMQRDLDAHEDKEKNNTKPSNDLNSQKDIHITSQALAELSKDHISITYEGDLMHSGDVGLNVDSKHHEKADVEPVQPGTGSSFQPTSKYVAGLVTLPELEQGSSELKDEEENNESDQRTESDILLSVLARAHKTRPPVLKRITTLEPKPEAGDDMIPTIVIMSSESPNPKEMEGNKHPTSFLDTSVEASTTPSYTADAWEDEGVDSDDDTYGSELSSRKGYSATALSLTDRTGSLLSVYSDAGDFGDVEVQGSVEFAMMYSPVGELIIMIEQCQDLAIAIPRKQRTDPYVKTYLYPDKSHRSKRKTSIKKRTVNPVYVESLRYKVKREELPEKTLNLSVWHNDSRGRNMFLGQVEISLKTWDWGHEALSWYNLQPKVDRKTILGRFMSGCERQKNYVA